MRPLSVGASRCQLGNEAIIEDLLAQIKVKRKTPESSSSSPVPEERVLSPLQTKKKHRDLVALIECYLSEVFKQGREEFFTSHDTAATSLLHAAESQGDGKVLLQIGEDLIEAEAKYHRLCYMSYALHEQPKSVIVTHFLCYSMKYTNL